MTHLLNLHPVCRRIEPHGNHSLVSKLISGPENVRAPVCTRRFNAKIGHALFQSLFQHDDTAGRSLDET